jgi:(p)ppGpp synthase/HD superfamily hydrolase
VGEDKKGVLKDLSEAISKMNINITSVETKVYDNMAETYFVISINNNRQLDRLFKKLTAFHHVDYVERTT